MNAVIIILAIVVVLVIGGIVWFTCHKKRLASNGVNENDDGKGLRFHWSYIILPVVVLILSVALTACFYHLLPAEVAYHFQLDGTPDKWFSREMTIVWALLPQFLLVLIAGILTWGITKTGILSGRSGDMWLKPDRIVLFMGNIIVLPQLIIGFAMLDIFSYNSYQVHLMPMWILIFTILGLSTLALLILVIIVFSKAKQQLLSHPKDKESSP